MWKTFYYVENYGENVWKSRIVLLKNVENHGENVGKTFLKMWKTFFENSIDIAALAWYNINRWPRVVGEHREFYHRCL